MDGAVLFELLVLIGRRLPLQEQEFGAQQAASLGAALDGDPRFVHRTQVGEHGDMHAIHGAAGLASHGQVGGIAPATLGKERGNGRMLIRGGGELQEAALGVEEDGGASCDLEQSRADRNQGRDPERRGDDGDVRGRAATRGAETGEPRRVESEQLRGQQIVGHQDRVVGQGRMRCLHLPAAQRDQHVAFDVAQIGDALLHPRIVQRQQPLRRAGNRATPAMRGTAAGIDMTLGLFAQAWIQHQLGMGLEDAPCRALLRICQ